MQLKQQKVAPLPEISAYSTRQSCQLLLVLEEAVSSDSCSSYQLPRGQVLRSDRCLVAPRSEISVSLPKLSPHCNPFRRNYSAKFGICTVVALNGTLVED